MPVCHEIEKTMKKVLHKANTRGFFDHGWLKTNHTFSFAHYHDPERMHFGKLRVLNDDIVAPDHGFGTHPHEDMEIASIPLAGSLAHKDSTGHEEVIRPNDIQVMSAGTGIRHSEYNASSTETVNFLQIWILPDAKGHAPRYDQKSFDPSARKNKFQTVVAPKKENCGLWLNQNAYLALASMDEGLRLQYNAHSRGNGFYLFVIEGELDVANEKLGKRDGIGLWELEKVDIEATENAEVLLIEVAKPQ